MNDSGSRRKIGAELFIMAGAAWVIPAGKGGMFPHRRISIVPLPGHFNPRDISWVVEYPALQPPAETAPRSNARTLLRGRMIRSGALRRVFALGAILLGLLSFFVAVGRSEAQPIATVTEAVNNISRAPLGVLADLTDGARVERS